MSFSDGLDPYLFLSKEGKDAVYERRNGRKGVISRHSWHFSIVKNMIKLFFPVFTLNGRVNNYVPREGKRINRRNESTIIKI